MLAWSTVLDWLYYPDPEVMWLIKRRKKLRILSSRRYTKYGVRSFYLAASAFDQVWSCPMEDTVKWIEPTSLPSWKGAESWTCTGVDMPETLTVKVISHSCNERDSGSSNHHDGPKWVSPYMAAESVQGEIDEYFGECLRSKIYQDLRRNSADYRSRKARRTKG